MSDLADALVAQIRLIKLPAPQTEYRFHPVRKWRADLAWPAPDWLIVEVDGGGFRGGAGGGFALGRHTTGTGFEADCEKLNTAVVDGWRVLRVTRKHIRSGQALTWIETALRGAKRG